MKKMLYLCIMKKLITTLTATFLLLGCNQVEITDNQQGISNYDNCTHVHENFTKNNNNSRYYNPNDKVIIIGLNDVSKDRLVSAEKIIKEFYGFKTEISPSNLKVDDKFYYNQSKTIINCDPFVRNFESNDRIVFITNQDMRGNVSPSVRGYTTVGGNILIVTSGKFLRETLIHEIGHTFGLLHCNNLSCVMAINNDAYDTETFCGNCKEVVNYYR